VRNNLKKSGIWQALGLVPFLHLQIDPSINMKKKAGMVGSLSLTQNQTLHL
jgi:hypothetical protein